VRQVLAAAAEDIESAGIDALSGSGLIQAVDVVQTVSDTGTGCVEFLELSEQTVSGAQFFRACDTITAGDDYEITASGDVRFQAGSTIVLEDGFSVASGGSFVAEIDPSL
jgi:hypothetical protein